MSLVHATVPWYAAIPLTAFLVRGLLVTTAGTYSRALMARYIGLHPLRQALAFQKRDEILKRGNFRTIKQAKLTVKKEVNDTISALDKRWNVSLRGQISWTLFQFPIFIAMAEVIRQKWFEPSLAAEGILWFQDLLVPDPTGALPFITSGIMFANIYTTKNTVESDGSRRWPGVLRRTLLFVSLLIGPLCQELPAALMLYWSSSTASVMLWNLWLDRKYPAPRGYTACKRPLLMPPSPVSEGRKVLKLSPQTPYSPK